jgi:hypothetical protein
MNIKGELKIFGINPVLISTGLVALYALLAFFAGDLLNLSCIGFEVVFPFFAAIAVGEWGKSRADDNFDVIAAQGKSLFSWVLSRFLAVLLTVCLFAVIGMIIVVSLRHEMPLWELIVTYLSPALFLASLTALLNLCFSAEHISTMICGVVWLVTMLTQQGLLRIPGVKYVYLFIRYTGGYNGIWLINKTVLFCISIFFWIIVYVLCRKRLLRQD